MVLYGQTASTAEVEAGRLCVVQGQLNHTGACLKSTRSNLVRIELIRTGSVSETACPMGRDQDTDTQREDHVSTWQESGHS